jgi:hypothetical protein
MIIIIPIIDGSMVLTQEEIIIAGEIVFDHHPFNANGKFCWRGRSEFKNGFSQKRKPVIKLGSDEQVLLSKSKRDLPVLVGTQGIDEAPDMGILDDGVLSPGWK